MSARKSPNGFDGKTDVYLGRTFTKGFCVSYTDDMGVNKIFCTDPEYVCKMLEEDILPSMMSTGQFVSINLGPFIPRNMRQELEQFARSTMTYVMGTEKTPTGTVWKLSGNYDSLNRKRKAQETGV